jgi:hypothetical protein
MAVKSERWYPIVVSQTIPAITFHVSYSLPALQKIVSAIAIDQ